MADAETKRCGDKSLTMRGVKVAWVCRKPAGHGGECETPRRGIAGAVYDAAIKAAQEGT